MPKLLHEFILNSANKTPDAEALLHKKSSYDYQSIAQQTTSIAGGLCHLGLNAGERVAIYLPKRVEAVISFFASNCAGAVFVPVNPLLKPEQVAYILRDCNVRVLISSHDRLKQLEAVLSSCHDLNLIVDVNNKSEPAPNTHFQSLHWQHLLDSENSSANKSAHRRIDTDIASILYTSGSTGNPKGVVLSHRNMIVGAKSVAEYLKNTADDNLLAVLPFSFDYGLSQLTTAFHVGAKVTLMDYLLPRDVIKAIEKFQITGLAGVPPLWNQLAQLDWSGINTQSLRYITNSGGAMPKATLNTLRAATPDTDVYLMYGLTEAFRSTYLPPEEIDNRPDSMGKAIPNAEVMVVREDGSLCAPGEPGELVHRGSLVSLGYWNDAKKTAEHFKPVPQSKRETENGLTLTEIAVWSGDKVKMDEDGFLYFIARQDDMIKTSGYRVSPSEVEEVIYATGLISEAAALGVSHPTLGQAIVVIVTAENNTAEELMIECKKQLPNFMHPAKIEYLDKMPKNPNGKIDRKQLALQYANLFQETQQ